MEFRVGNGIDIHQLVKGRKFVLGGIEIPSEKGMLAHSDGDVLLHAVTDALLGAIGAPDIGELFPNSDPRFANADSKIFVQEALRRLRVEGWSVANIDCTILLEEPKLKPFKEALRTSIATLLEIAPTRCVVKATTAEKLGFVGQGEGIWCQATVLIQK
jgi:2-C-methyl-D-erythritol 2,4-cyclodiphosphate synthase